MVREAALAATASDLAKDVTLRDSLGADLSGHAQAQARKLRGQRARDQGHRRQQRRRRQGPRHQRDSDAATASSAAGPADGAGGGEASGRGDGGGKERGSGSGAGDWTEKAGSVTEQVERASASTVGGDGGGSWEENTFEYDGRLEGEEQRGESVEGESADRVSTM